MSYVAALASDPTEKKPFFHVLPGSDTLTFGMLGCDLHCGYCQNWLTSQALRDDSAGTAPTIVTSDRLVSMAKAYGAAMVGSSYNDPLITRTGREVQETRTKDSQLRHLKRERDASGSGLPSAWTDCYKLF